MSYWYVPGTMHPYWWLNHRYATNCEDDTTLGGIPVGEFHAMFPQAFPIAETDVDNITPAQGLAYARYRREGGGSDYDQWVKQPYHPCLRCGSDDTDLYLAVVDGRTYKAWLCEVCSVGVAREMAQ